jgi:hypothetical protein
MTLNSHQPAWPWDDPYLDTKWVPWWMRLVVVR